MTSPLPVLLRRSSRATSWRGGCDPQPAAKELVKRLASAVDLSPVLRQLTARGASPEAARAQLRELQRFLVLKALSRDGEEPGATMTLSPSRHIDSVWHALMLRPKLYAARAARSAAQTSSTTTR